jgi:ssDNA-binding Zn-finger/Zn-ribbon topoisomerase 1
MDEKVFSQFIKFLDREHEEILNKIKEKKQELQELEREYYEFSGSKRDMLSRQLYALESSPQKDNEAIERIRKELNSLPSREELEVKITQLKEEIEKLQNDFVSKPFVVAESTITPHITYRIDADGLYIVQDPKTGVCYVKQNLNGIALNNYQIETDSNGVPIKEVWIKQDSDTYGIPLKFERQLKITSPVFEIIKPIRKEVVKEVPEYKEVKVSKFIPSLTCPRCSWNLTDKMRLINCPNCGLSLFDAVKLAVEKELGVSSLKENKKKRWSLF